MPAIPKQITFRNAAYLNYIREKPCCVCGGRAEAHHVRRQRWGSGTSKKPHDYVAIPLCPEHHDPETEKFLVKIEYEIIEYLMGYIESKRRGNKL